MLGRVYNKTIKICPRARRKRLYGIRIWPSYGGGVSGAGDHIAYAIIIIIIIVYHIIILLCCCNHHHHHRRRRYYHTFIPLVFIIFFSTYKKFTRDKKSHFYTIYDIIIIYVGNARSLQLPWYISYIILYM